MFTGIIETVGLVRELVPAPGKATRIVVEAPKIAAEVALGDSVAVDGACLTVCNLDRPGLLCFDVVQETLDKSALGELAAGTRVNLERAMRAGQRLDGHIVQGHVDGVGRVDRLERVGEDVRLFIRCEPEFGNWLVDKGSVAISGVSLTVVGARPDAFDVALIPHTLLETTLGDLEPGTRVNLEADILGKYVKSYLDRLGLPGSSAS